MRRTHTLERHVKEDVKELLAKHGWFFWMPGGSMYGVSGVSDICALKKGRFLAAECKFGSNKPSALQMRFLENVRTHGGYDCVVNEKNIAQFAALLVKIDEKIEKKASR